jgi:hypothetical protein
MACRMGSQPWNWFHKNDSCPKGNGGNESIYFKTWRTYDIVQHMHCYQGCGECFKEIFLNYAYSNNCEFHVMPTIDSNLQLVLIFASCWQRKNRRGLIFLNSGNRFMVFTSCNCKYNNEPWVMLRSVMIVWSTHRLESQSAVLNLISSDITVHGLPVTLLIHLQAWPIIHNTKSSNTD